MTGRAYVHRRSADTNLAEIHEEMSELIIRQTSECMKKEFEKTSGVHESSRKPTKKCAMKMKERKNTTAA